MNGLTSRQRDVLAAIRRLTIDGVAPTVSELCEDLGFRSRSSLHRMLLALRERRAVDWIDRSARSIRVLENGISRAELEQLGDDDLKRVASWAHSILAARARS